MIAEAQCPVDISSKLHQAYFSAISFSTMLYNKSRSRGVANPRSIELYVSEDSVYRSSSNLDRSRYPFTKPTLAPPGLWRFQ